MNNDLDSIKAGLAADDPKEFSARLEDLFAWVETSHDSYRNQRGVGALVEVACAMERKLEIRLLAIQALLKIGPKAPDEVNYLIGICTEEKEPLRLRWAAYDALKAIKPSLTETLIYHKELFDRSIDPDNPPPKLDISKARADLAEKQRREMNFYPLIALFLFISIMGTIYSYDKIYFWPIIAGWVVLTVGFIAWVFIRSRRCPKCKRWFARGPLESAGEYMGPSMPIGSLGPGASPVHTSVPVSIYETRCRYCQHPWIVVR